MHFSYQLLLIAPIKARIVSFAYLFILLTSNLKNCYKACIWLMQGFLPIICL